MNIDKRYLQSRDIHVLGVHISLQGKRKAASWEQFPVTVHGISIKD